MTLSDIELSTATDGVSAPIVSRLAGKIILSRLQRSFAASDLLKCK
jgi:hypothetical protein